MWKRLFCSRGEERGGEGLAHRVSSSRNGQPAVPDAPCAAMTTPDTHIDIHTHIMRMAYEL
jgi:hypothetical protein